MFFEQLYFCDGVFNPNCQTESFSKKMEYLFANRIFMFSRNLGYYANYSINERDLFVTWHVNVVGSGISQLWNPLWRISIHVAMWQRPFILRWFSTRQRENISQFLPTPPHLRVSFRFYLLLFTLLTFFCPHLYWAKSKINKYL